jgi:hypothetical protein
MKNRRIIRNPYPSREIASWDQWQGKAKECRESWAALWIVSECANPTPSIRNIPNSNPIAAMARLCAVVSLAAETGLFVRCLYIFGGSLPIGDQHAHRKSAQRQVEMPFADTGGHEAGRRS